MLSPTTAEFPHDRRGFGVSKEPQQPVRQSVSHIRSNRPEAMTAAIATRMAVIRSCNMLSATSFCSGSSGFGRGLAPPRSRHGQPRRRLQCARSCVLLSLLPLAIDVAASAMRSRRKRAFFNGWRSTPGTIPATSQLDRLISMTAISVPFGSRAVRDRLGSFNLCGALHRFTSATMECHILAAAP